MTNNCKYKVTEKTRDTLDSKAPHRHISASDLNRIGYTFEINVSQDLGFTLQKVKYCDEVLDKDTFDKALWYLGVDSSKGVYIEAVFHRSVHTNQPLMGYRFGGLERSDTDWIEGMFASYEAKMLASKMTDMLDTVTRMSKPLSSSSSEIAEKYFSKKNRKK